MWVYALLLLLIAYDAVRVACLAVEGMLWLWGWFWEPARRIDLARSPEEG